MDYAYLHCRPNGVPFYVGKGKLRRARNTRERNSHHAAIVSKYGAQNILIGMFECSTEGIAYELEAGLIKCLKASGIKLANYTAGGDGGRNPCEETRKRLSEAAKRRGVSEATRQAVSRAKKGVAVPEHVRAKLQAAALGKVFSETHKANISKSAKLRGVSFRTREAQKLAVSRPVRAGGIIYPSIVAAAKALNCSKDTLQWALKKSKTINDKVVEFVK